MINYKAYKSRKSLISWIFRIDFISFAMIIAFMIIGLILITTASIPIANRLGVSNFYFIKRQLCFVALGIALIALLSNLSERNILRLSLAGFLVSLSLMLLLIFISGETKGARRWLNLFGISLQPSEFLKPFYTVLVAKILSSERIIHNISNLIICALLNAAVAMMLMLQPDFGMSITITCVTVGQMFIAGLKLFWLIGILALGVLFAFLAYFLFPHIASRVDKFLFATDGANYQVEKSIKAYTSGGFTGKGPGEGTLKFVLPDSHTDFIFAVLGEEFGIISCILVVTFFAFFIIRGMFLLFKLNNLFYLYAAFGCLIYFAIQVAFNVGVTLNLLPTKGLTLPFISYGGSSMIACSILAGIYLNFLCQGAKYHKGNTQLIHVSF